MKQIIMENSTDDVILLIENPHKRSFLCRKVSLTVPACALLIGIFFSSLLTVSLISFYSIGKTVCLINNSEEIKLDVVQPRPIYYSRPKRSLTPKTSDLPCFDSECCTTVLDPNKPWTQSRLPMNIYPVEYQLTLELAHLNEEYDEYNGTIDIVIEVQTPTFDIILHGDLLYTDFIVSQRSSPENIPLTIDCVIVYPDTQTITIHLKEQLKIGSMYDVRISFFRALNIHGVGLFENQFNKDQFGFE